MKQTAGALLSSIRLDRSSRRSISVQLYQGLRDVILSGGLRAGERLPATRTLAKETGVSRTTVIDAIDRLVAEGMLVSRVGRAPSSATRSTVNARRPSAMPRAPRAANSRDCPTRSAMPVPISRGAPGCRTGAGPLSPRCPRSRPFRWRIGRAFRPG